MRSLEAFMGSSQSVTRFLTAPPARSRPALSRRALLGFLPGRLPALSHPLHPARKSRFGIGGRELRGRRCCLNGAWRMASEDSAAQAS